MQRPIILYDDDCGFCKWMVQWFLLWDRRDLLRTLPIQQAEAWLADMDPDERLESWHLVLPDGRRSSGGAAFPPLLRMLPGGKPLAALVVRIPGVTDRCYRWVARNRRALSKPIRRNWKDNAARRVRARHQEP